MKIFVPTRTGVLLTTSPTIGVAIGRLDIIDTKLLEGMGCVKPHPHFNFFRVASNGICQVLFTNSDTELATKDDYLVCQNDGGQVIAVPKDIKFISIRGFVANQIVSVKQGEYVEV
jgi:hypothetical protein